MKKTLLLIFLIPLFSACASSPQILPTPTQADPTMVISTPTDALPPTPTMETAPTDTPIPLPTDTPTPLPTLGPDDWQTLPVLPTELSETVFTIYKLGKMRGNNPNAFSKVGDCNSIYPDFLTEFDLRPEKVKLGEYADLQVTIDYFQGSWGRDSLAAKVGLSAHAAMAPLWADWKVCAENETPLDCEYRIHQPAFAILSFGTNDANGVVDFENSMRRVIEDSIGNGVVPILSTKPDNAEGDHSINLTIARLAMEYDLPLWNFWAAVQPLPEHGMKSPEHLSYSERIGWADFETKGSLNYGWAMRNLSALQLMDAIREMILEWEASQN